MRSIVRAALLLLASGLSGCNCSAPAPAGGDGGVDLAGADLTGPPMGDLFSPPDLAIGGPCTMPTLCFSGDPKWIGVGACRQGVQMCVNGMAGPCTGEVLPATESCNGVDDDCNGMADDGLGTVSCGIGACQNSVPACTAGKPTACVPKPAANAETCGNSIDDNCNGAIDEGCGCTYVSPQGNDMTGNGTAQMPFRTIQKGIAAAGTNGLPKTVCVASGLACPSQFDYAEDVVMRDGVSVLGGYQVNGMSWPRNAQCVTRILPTQAKGVVFDQTVTTPTLLDGFTVNGHADPQGAAITVTGSTGAMIENDAITGGGTTTSFGVEVTDAGGKKATPIIARSAIIGGTGTALSVGVRSLNSAPVIQANCDTIDPQTGRCTSGCFNTQRFIRSRAQNNMGTTSYGVRLESSPNAVVAQSAICGFGSSADAAGVRLSGDGAGVLIHANNIQAFGQSQNAVAFWADACNGASPWILDNQALIGSSGLQGGRADGVRAVGDCHVRVDANVRIVGGVESANNDANGVLCAKDPMSGAPSRCTVLNNLDIRGAGGGFPPQSTGVRCEDKCCARIENNAITAVSGVVTYGVYLNNTGAFVSGNRIEAGCAQREGTGLLSNNSYARVQNNAIAGVTCANGATTTAQSYGVRALTVAGLNELDLHSNDLFGAGFANACTSRALALDVVMGANPPAGPLGVYRNNILIAGQCTTRYNVEEQSGAADPRRFENNDLWSINGMPTALYRDENMSNLNMLMQVNGLVGAAMTLNADPLFGANLHLSMGSPCINTGTATGAPLTDFENDTRPQQGMFDIGWDEYKP
jgi:Putative metal-binding motif